MRSFSWSRYKVLAAATVYVLLFQWVYVNAISPAWSYSGLTAQPRPAYLSLLAVTAACLPGLVTLRRTLQRASEVLYLVLYGLVYVPTMIVGSFQAEGNHASFALFILVLTGCFLGLGMIHRVPLATIPRLTLPGELFWPLLLALSIASYAYLSTQFQLGIVFDSITDVYNVRADYKETAAASGSALLAYVVNWNAYVINPFYIGFGLSRRKPLLVILGILGQLAIFSFTGFKQVFFSAFLIAALVLGIRRYQRSFAIAALVGLGGLVVGAVLIDYLVDSLMTRGIFVRRLIAIPGLMTFRYWEFFSSHELARLGHTFLSPIMDYPYALPPQNLIALVYLDTSTISANGNIWADAYANFGYLGMVLFTGVLGAVMWVFDSVSRKQDLVLTSLLLTVPAFGLVNAALFSTLLSHGLGAGILLAMIKPATRRRGRQTNRSLSGEPLTTGLPVDR